jgi:rhamnosyltransferase
MRDQIAAVVTTFCPDSTLIPNLQSVSEQVALIILVDDTGSPAHETVPYSISNLVCIRNADNLGIAKSLNIGIERAISLGFKWILTLDDDTRLVSDYVSAVFSFIARNSERNLGIVALARGDRFDERGAAAAPFTVKRNIITSGSIFETDVFAKVGGFCEGLFIDLVDFDFCCRIRRDGRELVILNQVGMEHKVGNSRTASWLGVAIVVFHHPPFRLYYQARNAILFAKQHFSFDPLLCSYILLDLVRIPLKAILFEAQKLSRLRYAWAGIRDGVRGRVGKIP